MQKILPFALRGIILWLFLFIIIPSLKGNFTVTKWTICSAVICVVILLIVSVCILKKEENEKNEKLRDQQSSNIDNC